MLICGFSVLVFIRNVGKELQALVSLKNDIWVLISLYVERLVTIKHILNKINVLPGSQSCAQIKWHRPAEVPGDS